MAQELERRLVALQESSDELDDPRVAVGRAHGGEPHEPVETEVVRRDLGRQALRVARLPFELVRLPPLGRSCVAGALEDDLVALLRDVAERAVGADEVEAVEAEVHELAARQHVADRPVAQDGDEHGERDHEPLVPVRRCDELGTVERQHVPEGGVAEREDRQHDREEVQPREVARQDQPRLRQDDDPARDAGDRLRREQEERHDELREVVCEDLDLVRAPGEVVEEPAQRVRHRLGLVVVVEARQVPPAPVAAQLDEAGAELDAEHEPSQQPDDEHGRYETRRSQEDHEKPGFEEQ